MDCPGYVYLLKAEGPLEGYYKIGRTRNIPKRMGFIKLQLPCAVSLVHIESVPDTTLAEAFLHSFFADLRVNGEWFELQEEDIAAFRVLCRDIVPNPYRCEVFRLDRPYTTKEWNTIKMFAEGEYHEEWGEFISRQDITGTRWERLKKLQSRGHNPALLL